MLTAILNVSRVAQVMPATLLPIQRRLSSAEQDDVIYFGCELLCQDTIKQVVGLTQGQATGGQLTSRHINIHFFWLNDRLAKGEISMRYIPTTDMTADLLTKHMEGSSFYKHRSSTMLNIN
jgi:hypothetical protein